MTYGLDMTEEMLALAEKHRAEAGIENARFMLGTIEDVPMPDASVDVVISNCVINLSADKDAVLREAFRVLRPGGTGSPSPTSSLTREIPAGLRASSPCGPAASPARSSTSTTWPSSGGRLRRRRRHRGHP